MIRFLNISTRFPSIFERSIVMCCLERRQKESGEQWDIGKQRGLKVLCVCVHSLHALPEKNVGCEKRHHRPCIDLTAWNWFLYVSFKKTYFHMLPLRNQQAPSHGSLWPPTLVVPTDVFAIFWPTPEEMNLPLSNHGLKHLDTTGHMWKCLKTFEQWETCTMYIIVIHVYTQYAYCIWSEVLIDASRVSLRFLRSLHFWLASLCTWALLVWQVASRTT